MVDNHIETHRWLLTAEAAEYLARTHSELSMGTDIVRLVRQLRKKISPHQTALIVEQSRLRIRATRKFPNASQMFFTGTGLEMATDHQIATFKSRRFVNRNRVADICCSIGGDLIGMVASNPGHSTEGFDSDELAVIYANANLSANGLPASAHQGTFEDLSLNSYDAIHIDPERRKQGRTIHGDHFSPRLSEIISQTAHHNAVAIKVAPATRNQNEYPEDVERQWIGHSRECKQQVIWIGELANHPGCRSAVRIGKTGVTEFVCNSAQADATQVEIANSVGDFVYEPHNVVLAAALTNAIAAQFRLARISSKVAYLTGNDRVDNQLLARFRVFKTMNANLSVVAQAIQQFNFGYIEVKKRGVPEFMAEKYKRIKVSGEGQGTVILTRDRDRHIAIIAQRETSSDNR